MRNEALDLRLKAFRLPSFLESYADTAHTAQKEGWGHVQYLETLSELEAEDRQGRRVMRLLKESQLPKDKTLSTLKLERFHPSIRTQVRALAGGDFLPAATNVCVFGSPGTGKTHIVAAIGHELVRRGHNVLFTLVSELVEKLLAAKRDLKLAREFRKLDRFDCVILDDIGYVKHDREEMEVLFALLAERYERKSVMITTNLVFSKWDQIFKDAMTTAAAVDRVVHHSVILELNLRSYRAEEALSRKSQKLPETKDKTPAKEDQQ
jgi:DNA replication protein DnaC